MDDKHKVKVGEPGCPPAAVERGQQGLVGLDKVFQGADHDISWLTLIPSVTFAIDNDIPNSIDGSFYEGQVHVGLKNSVFEASSPSQHATEIGKILDGNKKKEILAIYTDGGPDHRLNFVSVQLSLICLFLKHDLDALIAVCSPPGHSWKDLAERVMSILNRGLQAVGVMRNEKSPEYEDPLKKCNNMKEIHKASEKNKGLKGALQTSMDQPVTLISSIFEQLELKVQPFKIFSACTKDEMAELEATLQQIDGALSCKTTKAAVEYDNEVFPNVFQLFKITVTLPATSCERECSNIVLRRLNNYMRCSMGEVRRMSLVIAHIHYNTTVDGDEVVDISAHWHARKLGVQQCPAQLSIAQLTTF